jgi:hypothetical protein
MTKQIIIEKSFFIYISKSNQYGRQLPPINSLTSESAELLLPKAEKAPQEISLYPYSLCYPSLSHVFPQTGRRSSL